MTIIIVTKITIIIMIIIMPNMSTHLMIDKDTNNSDRVTIIKIIIIIKPITIIHLKIVSIL